MAGALTPPGPPLRALVVDEEAPALTELAGLLGRDPRIGPIRTACSGPEALRVLDCEPVDVVFCDITTSGLAGPDLARGLDRCARRPQLVFLTTDARAPDTTGLRATDYVTKPVRATRLAEAIRRVVEITGGSPEPSPEPSPEAAQEAVQEPPDDDETITVELGGVTRFVQRSQVRYVQAQGDYARLHTATGSHLVRIPLTTLEERWAGAGFVRIHRSTLVALPHVDEVTVDSGRWAVRLGERILRVSRRHTRDLRDRVVRSTREPRPGQE
jgi:DNA-binding LytR/AlgR family response regulator